MYSVPATLKSFLISLFAVAIIAAPLSDLAENTSTNHPSDGVDDAQIIENPNPSYYISSTSSSASIPEANQNSNPNPLSASTQIIQPLTISSSHEFPVDIVTSSSSSSSSSSAESSKPPSRCASQKAKIPQGAEAFRIRNPFQNDDPDICIPDKDPKERIDPRLNSPRRVPSCPNKITPMCCWNIAIHVPENPPEELSDSYARDEPLKQGSLCSDCRSITIQPLKLFIVFSLSLSLSLSLFFSSPLPSISFLATYHLTNHSIITDEEHLKVCGNPLRILCCTLPDVRCPSPPPISCFVF